MISANQTRGIYLTNASWNRIQGNLVGTTANGILPLPNTFHNVETESRDPDSILSVYRRVLALRRSNLALRNGTYEVADRLAPSPDVNEGCAP